MDGRTVVAVLDGLGHGNEAANAADAAVAVLESRFQEPLVSLVEHCDRALVGTRGVVIGLASIDSKSNKMEWLGVGNVEGVLLRSRKDANPRRIGLLMRGGVVGGNLPPLRVTELSIESQDTLVFATDGLGSGFTRELTDRVPPRSLADALLQRHAKDDDDALILVARYRGSR